MVLTKLAVAALCSAALTCGPMLLAGLIAAGGLGEGLVLGMIGGAAIGSVLYCSVFVAVSLVTGRALVFGLAYVLIWEGLLAGLFAGTRTFSVRQLTLAFADAIGGIPADIFDAPVSLITAVVVGIPAGTGDADRDPAAARLRDLRGTGLGRDDPVSAGALGHEEGHVGRPQKLLPRRLCLVELGTASRDGDRQPRPVVAS